MYTYHNSCHVITCTFTVKRPFQHTEQPTMCCMTLVPQQQHSPANAPARKAAPACKSGSGCSCLTDTAFGGRACRQFAFAGRAYCVALLACDCSTGLLLCGEPMLSPTSPAAPPVSHACKFAPAQLVLLNRGNHCLAKALAARQVAGPCNP